MIHISQIIIDSANASLGIQKEDGSFSEGINGPWDEVVTPVRNTSHWAFLLYTAYRISKNNIFREASIKACNYLLDSLLKSENTVFHCRIYPENKQNSNGLIGQAWAVESLILVGALENNPDYINTARNILEVHPFNHKKNLYEGVEINGQSMGISGTLNQQIWFSAMSLFFCHFIKKNNTHIYNNAIACISNIISNIDTYSDGCIRHSIKPSFLGIIKKTILSKLNKNPSKESFQKELSFGYHSFVLTGLALAYKYSSEEKFWIKILNHPKIKNALLFGEKNIVDGDIFGKFSYQYNPTGIEIAFSIHQLMEDNMDKERKIEIAINSQLSAHYDFDKKMMTKNTIDPATLSARIYEICYLISF
jgi:hypothetical protein